MKNMKSILVKMTLLIATVTSYTLQAAPNFEIYNKSKTPIKVRVSNIRGEATESSVPADQVWRTTVNSVLHGFRVAITTADNDLEVFDLHPEDKDETAYVSFDPNKRPALYPQTGPLMGLMGKHNPFFGQTKSGLPLTHNIASVNIKKMN